MTPATTRAAAGPADILVVDDQEEIRRLVTSALESQGFTVRTAASGPEAYERLAEQEPDLVVLDVSMPVVNGLEVLQQIRIQGATPVILVTALAAVENRVLGLQLGADDYVTKPFDLAELAARVHAVLRRTRSGSISDPVIRLDGLEIDRSGREVFVRGQPVEMTAKEFDLLCYLASSPGRVFTRQQLLRDVWHSSTEWQQEATVTEHIRRVRQKIEADPDMPRWVQTLRGVGYKFERRSQARVETEEAAFRRQVEALTDPLRTIDT